MASFQGQFTTAAGGVLRVFRTVATAVCRIVRDAVYRNSGRDVWITMRSTAQNSILPQQLVLAVPLTYCCKVDQGDFQLERRSSAEENGGRSRSVSAANTKCTCLVFEGRLLRQNIVPVGLLKGAGMYSDQQIKYGVM